MQSPTAFLVSMLGLLYLVRGLLLQFARVACDTTASQCVAALPVLASAPRRASASCPTLSRADPNQAEKVMPVCRFSNSSIAGARFTCVAGAHFPDTVWQLRLIDSCNRTTVIELASQAQLCALDEFVERPTPCSQAEQLSSGEATRVSVVLEARVYVKGGHVDLVTPYGPVPVPRSPTTTPRYSIKFAQVVHSSPAGMTQVVPRAFAHVTHGTMFEDVFTVSVWYTHPLPQLSSYADGTMTAWSQPRCLQDPPVCSIATSVDGTCKNVTLSVEAVSKCTPADAESFACDTDYVDTTVSVTELRLPCKPVEWVHEMNASTVLQVDPITTDSVGLSATAELIDDASGVALPSYIEAASIRLFPRADRQDSVDSVLATGHQHRYVLVQAGVCTGYCASWGFENRNMAAKKHHGLLFHYPLQDPAFGMHRLDYATKYVLQLEVWLQMDGVPPIARTAASPSGIRTGKVLVELNSNGTREVQGVDLNPNSTRTGNGNGSFVGGGGGVDGVKSGNEPKHPGTGSEEGGGSRAGAEARPKATTKQRNLLLIVVGALLVVLLVLFLGSKLWGKPRLSTSPTPDNSPQSADGDVKIVVCRSQRTIMRRCET